VEKDQELRQPAMTSGFLVVKVQGQVQSRDNIKAKADL
jgi:hypothetical protein